MKYIIIVKTQNVKALIDKNIKSNSLGVYIVGVLFFLM